MCHAIDRTGASPRSDLKNHGYGWLLMQAIINYALFQGIREIEGDVLACNATMLRMCRELGFAVSHRSDDAQGTTVKLNPGEDSC